VNVLPTLTSRSDAPICTLALQPNSRATMLAMCALSARVPLCARMPSRSTVLGARNMQQAFREVTTTSVMMCTTANTLVQAHGTDSQLVRHAHPNVQEVQRANG